MLDLWQQKFPHLVAGTLKHYHLYCLETRRFIVPQIWGAAGVCGDPWLCQVACKGRRKELITADTIRVHVVGWLEQRGAGDGVSTSLLDDDVAAVKSAYPDTAPKPSVIDLVRDIWPMRLDCSTYFTRWNARKGLMRQHITSRVQTAGNAWFNFLSPTLWWFFPSGWCFLQVQAQAMYLTLGARLLPLGIWYPWPHRLVLLSASNY